MPPAPNCISAVSSRSSNKSFSPPVLPGLHCVGWVKSAHGLRGEIFIRLYAGEADWDADALFLLPPGKSAAVEFPLRDLSAHKDGFIARLEGVNDRNASEALQRSGVYIPEEDLRSEAGERIFLRQIQGFEVIDQTLGSIGRIEGFASNGPQDLLRVKGARPREILIPLVDAFLVQIDFDNERLHMDLPPGLIDVEE
ncbi:MAG TPA: ribosome maturation factor RimM [Bdellovibrionales bacterium]|nr:ribosome maturation factor RimM [Bdellovibrionales bacterium]